MSYTQHGQHGHGDGHGDEWFRHSSAEAVQLSHGEFNGYGIAGFLMAVIVCVFSIIVIFVGWLNRAVAGEEERVVDARTSLLAGPHHESMAKWEGELFGDPVWLDGDTVRLPLDSAAAAVVKAYSER